jgi:hypothetical protein
MFLCFQTRPQLCSHEGLGFCHGYQEMLPRQLMNPGSRNSDFWLIIVCVASRRKRVINSARLDQR